MILAVAEVHRKSASSFKRPLLLRFRGIVVVYFGMSTSMRNRLAGTIEKIVSDKVVSEILVKTAAGLITSIITTESVQRLKLKEGDKVYAVIKATGVSVEKE